MSADEAEQIANQEEAMEHEQSDEIEEQDQQVIRPLC